MRIFQNRPLALAVCVMAVIVSAAVLKPVRLLLLVVCAAALALQLLAILLRRRCGAVAGTVLLCLLLSTAGLFSSWLFFDRTVGRVERDLGASCVAEGYVRERLGSAPYQTRYCIQVQEWNGERVSYKMMLECEYLSALQVGDRFRIEGQLRSMKNTEGYQEEQTLRSDGMVGVLVCDKDLDCSIFGAQEQNLLLKMRNTQFVLSQRLQAAVGGEEGALAAALLLGDRSGLSDDTVLAFRRSGISHLLALSGLHVSVLIAALELLLRRLYLPKKLRAILIPLSAIGYLLLSGCAISTVRAVLMTCALYVGFLLWESYDAFTSICTALLLILLFLPYSVCDISLWMSFFAAGSIILFLPTVQEVFSESARLRRLPRWFCRILQALAMAVAVGLFASAAVLPLSAIFFGYTSVFAVPVTLLLSPILTPVLILSLVLLVLPQLMPLAAVVRFLLSLMLQAANRFSQIPNGTVLLTGVLTVILLVLLCLSLFVCAVLSLRRRWTVLPILLSCAVLLCAYADILPSRLGVCVSYVRKGENEMLLLSRERDAIAIDLSDGSTLILPMLQDALHEAKCTELRELILTHYHSKASYLIAELAADVKIDALRLPQPISEQEAAIAARLRQEGELHGMTVSFIERQTALPEVELLLSERNTLDTVEVVQHLTLRIGNKHLTYLSTGEREPEAAQCAQNATLSADILILGGHGSAPHTWRSLPQLPDDLEQLICASAELSEAALQTVTEAQVYKGVVRHRFFVSPVKTVEPSLPS